MSPVTHFLTGWVLANAVDLNRRDRAIVTIAAVVPDVDGLGIVAEILTRHSQHPLLWFSDYHHALHTLLFAPRCVCVRIHHLDAQVDIGNPSLRRFPSPSARRSCGVERAGRFYLANSPTCFHSATDGFGVGEASGNSMLGPILR